MKWPSSFVDKILTGDGLNILRAIPDESIDSIITDPPYCSGGITEAQRMTAKSMGVTSDRKSPFRWFIGDNMGTTGLAWTLRNHALEARRILRDSGHLLVFMDWRQVPIVIPAIESGGMRYQNLVVWNKSSIGLGQGFRASHELVMHFTNGKPRYHSRKCGNVLTFPRVKPAERQHQAEKPVPLLKQLIEVTTPEGGIVLDQFCGSGATLVAAKALGRHFIGIDISADYCRSARTRLQSTHMEREGRRK